MTRELILLVVWVIVGVVNLATNFNIQYLLCWSMLIVTLLGNVAEKYFDR